MSENLLEIEDLDIQYETSRGMLTAVSGATFSISRGEYLGTVGESGCGKSTLVKAIIGGLPDNGHITSGKIRYKGTEIQDYSEKELNDRLRWNEISYIPQSSMNSLDPLRRIQDQAVEIGKTHTNKPKDELINDLAELFEVVGISESRIHDYPHQFSGGMEQRAIIALSLLLEPSLILADEPTTALDVIMQDQILKYIEKIREELGNSMILVTHDINVVLETCGSQVIMHSGQICESGTTKELYESPKHPYSYLLQRAFPDHRRPEQDLEIIEGNPPETVGNVNYCSFADRCPLAVEECRQSAPVLEEVESGSSETDSTTHLAACYRKDDIQELADMTEDELDVVGQ